MDPLEQVGFDLLGHSAMMAAFCFGAWVVFKRFAGERIKKWDDGVDQGQANRETIEKHLATCDLRAGQTLEKLNDMCERLDDIKDSVGAHTTKLESLSTTVSEMVGREKERDRQARQHA